MRKYDINAIDMETLKKSNDNKLITFGPMMMEDKDDSSHMILKMILLAVILILTIIISLLSIFPDKNEESRREREMN